MKKRTEKRREGIGLENYHFRGYEKADDERRR
jgi:hypothetical protein